MAASIYNINIEQGAEYQQDVYILDGDGEPYDLTGLNIRMHIRPVNSHILIHELTEANGGIINYVPASGEFDIYIGATSTEDIPEGIYRYDIEAYSVANPDRVKRLLMGQVRVIPEVTY